MGFSIVISPIAQENISEAVDYYIQNASLEIVIAFYQEIQGCYDALENNPFFQYRIKSYRAFPLNKFPFLIFFEVEESKMTVKILAVFNTKQDPKKWP